MTQRKKRRKRLRKGRVFFLLLFISLISVICYGIFLFMEGKKAVELPSATQTQTFTPDLPNPTQPHVVNYLLLGTDLDQGTGRSRTDTMMVASWDTEQQTVKLISLMRDIYATIPGYQSYKLNTAYYLNGVQSLKEAINTMFDIPIHHYVSVDFDRFEEIINVAFPEGVTVAVEKDMEERIGVQLTQGIHRLNGQELLGYARFRADEEGDFGRVRRQQQVIEAVKEELFTLDRMRHFPKIAGAVSELVETDIESFDQLWMGIQLMMNQRKLTVETMTIPVEGSYRFVNYEHAGSVIEIDPLVNQQAIQSFLNH